MSGEHAPRPGATWERELLRGEQVVPDTTVPGMNEPQPPRPNRATRRATKRQARARDDTCCTVDLPTGPVRVRGSGELTAEAADALAALVAVAQRRFAEERPEPIERPTEPCSMAALHPSHLYLRDRQSTRCPGRDTAS